MPHCDVVTINAPLHPETEGLFDEAMIGRMKRGAYIVNTARARSRPRRDRAGASGQLAGRRATCGSRSPRPGPPVADDAPPCMTPHIWLEPVGAGAPRRERGEIPESFFADRPCARRNVIVDGGKRPAPAPTRTARVTRPRPRGGGAVQGRLIGLSQMSRTQYYCAMSLDGYIAESDDTLAWLMEHEGSFEGEGAEPGAGRLRALLRGRGSAGHGVGDVRVHPP